MIAELSTAISIIAKFSVAILAIIMKLPISQELSHLSPFSQAMQACSVDDIAKSSTALCFC